MPRSALLIILVSFVYQFAEGQKFSFENISVDKGLIQSQVLSITQDNQRHLWFGTFGGIDRFDGTSFRHFTKADGLNSSGITCLFTAANGKIWAGTFKGISSYDGLKFVNYPVQDKFSGANFAVITEDDAGVIWAFNLQKGLFHLQDSQFIKMVLPFADAVPTSICRNESGQLLVNFYKQGIYLYEKNKWRIFSRTDFLQADEFLTQFFNTDGTFYGVTNKKNLVKFSGDKLLYSQTIISDNIGSCLADGNNNIWIATSKGVFVYRSNDLAHIETYTTLSGLSESYTLSIFRDAENNMWLGTDGAGVFKFSGGAFAKYDSHSGLPGNIVMGITKDSAHNFYIATREGGLVNYTSEGKIIPLNYSVISRAGINCVAVDNENNLLLATLDNKLLKFNGKIFREIILAKNKPFINSIAPQGEKLWFATSSGCYTLRGDSAIRIKGIDEISVGILPVSEKRILAGTTGGLYTIDEYLHAKKVSSPLLQIADINCLAKYDRYILIGTMGDGVYLWEPQTDKVYQCNLMDGLADNNVFSIFIDKQKNIWVGTGTGVQQIFFDEKIFSFSVKKFSKADGYENSENNLNTITDDDQGLIWIGTTKGAFVFRSNIASKNDTRPFAVIQKVESPGIGNDSFSTGNRLPWYNYPASPELSYSNNNISFTVKGIFMRDPDAVLYSYQLEGYDAVFSVPASQTFFNYQNLEPGNYVFRVKAIAPGGIVSDNIAEYSFSVETPLHKTNGFLVLITMSLILTGVLIQYFLNKAGLRKQKQLELLRQEEREKVRQRTSEDFHDELGNKLSRISLLADILQKKTEPTDTEKNNLLQQIRENIQALYTGTKDVIWSLSPGSDNFLEVLQRIEQFGDDLFEDSSVQFSTKGFELVDPEIKLPMDFSRNIIMIFKEVLNNCLRHAKATDVTITVSRPDDESFTLSVLDNGIGFDKNHISDGNGLLNIQRRAMRIGANLEIVPAVSKGMNTRLTIKIPPNGG